MLVRHGAFAFEKKDVIDLDLFSGHVFLFDWMKRNSLAIRSFIASILEEIL
jgi:hypothetical protein